jgi:hypothetical protein
MTEGDHQSLQVRVLSESPLFTDAGSGGGEAVAAHASISILCQDFHLLVDAGAGFFVHYVAALSFHANEDN